MSDLWKDLIVMAGIGASVLLVAGLLAESYGRHQCSNYAIINGAETRWATLDACYVQTAQGWQRWDEYKARATASESRKGETE